MARENKIEIICEFGSDFQEETGMDCIALMLVAIQESIVSRHKQNKMQVKINNKDISEYELRHPKN